MHDPSMADQKLLEENALLNQRIKQLEDSEAGRTRAEEALKQSELKYRSLIESSSDAIFCVDEHGQYQFANQVFASTLGHSPEYFVGKTFWDVYPKEHADYRFAATARVFRTGQSQSLEVEVPLPTGSLFFYATANPIRDDTGKVVLVLTHATDITERKREAAALKSSNVRLEALWNLSSLPDADVKTASAHLLASIAPMTESAYGFYGLVNEDESVMTISAWSGEAMRNCSMADKPQSFPVPEAGVWAEAIRRKAPLILNDYAAAHEGKKGLPEGHAPLTNLLVVPIFSHGRITAVAAVANRATPYGPDDVQQITAFLRGIQTITDRKRAEDKLIFVMKAVESTSDAVGMSDAQGHHFFQNRASSDLFGYATAEEMEAAGGGPAVVKDPEVAKEMFAKIVSGKSWAGELEMVTKSGRVFPAYERADAIKDQEGHVVGLIGIVTDFSERKRAEEERENLQAQLQQAQKMETVGRLAGGVAHDFNNMLGVILGRGELALSKVSPSGPLHDDLMEILVAARRSAEITRQLLAFARKQTIAPTILDLNETVESMLKMLRRLIGEDIDLAWRPGRGLWPVRMDPSQVNQVMANLSINARDAIGGVGCVTVTTRNVALDEAACAGHAGFVPGECVLLTVSDNGCGMDTDTQANIFEPFFTTKGVGQGSGLGLATVYGIVTQNGGFIGVDSEPGKGTTFDIYLPRHEGHAVGTRMDIAAAIPVGGSETVLIVEDEVAILTLSRTILDTLGYTVLTARTTLEARRLADAHLGSIQLLITDVVMPDMNGRELAEELQRGCPALRCLFMSGYAADVIAARGVLAEDTHFIQKPFSVAELAAKVREVLGRE